MKRILALALSTLMAFGAFGTLAEEGQGATLGGVVIEATDSTVLLSTDEYGDVLVNYDDTTVLEGLEVGIQTGTYVIVTYSGAMTRSVPAQIFAAKIAMYVITGTVVEASDDGVLVDQGGESGLVFAHLQEDMLPLFFGCVVDVYYSGVMLLSYPGQIGALHVVTPTLDGTVTQLGDGYFLMTDADGQDYMVNNDDGTHFDDALNAGDAVSVYYNGAVAKSMPPQIYGIAVFHDVR